MNISIIQQLKKIDSADSNFKSLMRFVSITIDCRKTLFNFLVPVYSCVRKNRAFTFNTRTHAQKYIVLIASVSDTLHTNQVTFKIYLYIFFTQFCR